MDIVETIKGFLTSPVQAFQKVRDTDIVESLKYFIVILVINVILTVILDMVVANAMASAVEQTMAQMGILTPAVVGIGAILVAIMMIILSFFGLLIAGAWVHLFVYIVGGRKGYLQTVKALIFGSTPYMMIGWIPFIGPVIGGIWSLILEILGIRELHQISTGRAVAAMVLAVLIVLIIVILIAAWFLIALVSMGPVYSP